MAHGSGTLPMDESVFQLAYLPKELFKSSVWCAGAVAFLALVVFGKVSSRKLAFAAISFQALDIYSFRADMLHLRTVQLSPE